MWPAFIPVTQHQWLHFCFLSPIQCRLSNVACTCVYHVRWHIYLAWLIFLSRLHILDSQRIRSKHLSLVDLCILHPHYCQHLVIVTLNKFVTKTRKAKGCQCVVLCMNYVFVSTWTSGKKNPVFGAAGWPLWRWPLWRGMVRWERWPAAVVWGGCQEADKVHGGHHTRQELPLVVSRNPADMHGEMQMVEDEYFFCPRELVWGGGLCPSFLSCLKSWWYLVLSVWGLFLTLSGHALAW